MSYIRVTEERYQQAIRDRMIVEIISKIIDDKDIGYYLGDVGRMLIGVQGALRDYEADVARYPEGALSYDEI